MMEFATAKTSNETWAQYVERLFELNYISEEHWSKWQKGKPLKIKTKVTVTRFRAAMRSRLVDGNDDILEDYAVAVPFAEKADGTLSLPAPGTLPDDEEFEGFLNHEGEKIQTHPPEPTEKELAVMREELEKSSPQVVSRKSADESSESYVERLHSNKLISDADRKRWLQGELISVTKAVRRTVMVKRMQKRTMPDIGEEKTVEVNVPTSVSAKLILSLPAKGTQKENAINRGFAYE